MKESKRKKRQLKYIKNTQQNNQHLYHAIDSLLDHYPCKNDPFLSYRWRLLMYLRRLYHILDVAWEKELRDANITPAQYVALLTILTMDGLSMSELADLCLWNRSTASRISRSLEKKHLIQISLVDGKTASLKITKEGFELTANYLAQDAAEFKHSLAVVTDEAENCSNVYEWLKNSLDYLIGKETNNHITDIAHHLEIASSSKQILQSQAYRSDPSDS